MIKQNIHIYTERDSIQLNFFRYYLYILLEMNKNPNKNTYCYIWVKKSNKTYIKETKGKSFRTISYLLRTYTNYTYLLNVKKNNLLFILLTKQTN